MARTPRLAKEASIDKRRRSVKSAGPIKPADEPHRNRPLRRARQTMADIPQVAGQVTNPTGSPDSVRGRGYPKNPPKTKTRKEPCGGCGKLVVFDPSGPFCSNPHTKHIGHAQCKPVLQQLCRLCRGDRVDTVMPELSPEHQELFEREVTRGLAGMSEPDHFPGMETLFQALATVSHAQLTACLMERIRHDISVDSITSVATETARAGSHASEVASARTFADIANAVARTVSSTAAAVCSASTPMPPVASSSSKAIVTALMQAIQTIESIESRPPVVHDRDDLPLLEETVSEKGTSIPAYGLAAGHAMISTLFETYLEILPAKKLILPSQVTDGFIHILSRWAHGLAVPKRPMYVMNFKGVMHSCEVCSMKPSKPQAEYPEMDLPGRFLHHRARLTHRALAGTKEPEHINEAVRLGLIALLKMCLADHRRRLQVNSNRGRCAPSLYAGSCIRGDDDLDDANLAEEYTLKVSGDVEMVEVAHDYRRDDPTQYPRPEEAVRRRGTGATKIDLERSRSEEVKSPESPKNEETYPK